MKQIPLKTLSLFICLIANMQWLNAQTPSITAGQTAGMMVTVYDPAQFMWSPVNHLGTYSGGAEIDLNHDGVVDVVIRYNQYSSTPHNYGTYLLTTPNANVQLASVIDSGYGVYGGQTYYVSQLFYPADIIINGGGIWKGDSIIVYEYRYDAGGGGGTIGLDPFGAENPPVFAYFGGRLCINGDTSLFYIHIGLDSFYSTNLYDYAIQGPDTTFMLTSIPVLQKDNDPVKIFPVPALIVLQIQLNSQAQFEINNVLGENVKAGRLVSGDNQLDIANLSPGVYFVAIIGATGRTVKKIIKE